MKRTITEDEFDELCAALYQLTEILLEIGVVELKISKKEKEIFWDTENKAQIDPDKMYAFSEAVARLAFDMERKEERRKR